MSTIFQCDGKITKWLLLPVTPENSNEPTSSHEDAKQCAPVAATEQESLVITWEKLQCAAKIHKHIQKNQ